MAMNKQVSGVRCQVSGEQSGCSASFYNLKPRTYGLRAGFSLIELVVVIGIIVVITSVVLVSNTRYGGSVLLQNLAYDIALSIREAQVYGISVRGDSPGSFKFAYGMHFATNDNIHYELFADKNSNGLFTSDINNPIVDENVPPSPYVIGRGYYIAKLCAPAGTDSSCTDGTVVSQLDVVFKRPEPDACISIGGISAINVVTGRCSGGKDSARIILESPRGDLLSVVVDATGQISVQ